MNNKTIISITAKQAFECLYITINNRVRSIQTSGFYYGVELDLPRAKEILKNAENNSKLFLYDLLGGEYRHDIIAWDNKNQKWVYFECIPEEIEALKKMVALKAS